LRRTGRRLAQDPEPREGVLAEVPARLRPRHRRADDAVRAVGAHNEVGVDLERPSVAVGREDAGTVGCRALDALRGDPEPQVLSRCEPCRDEVLERLVLRVQPHAPPDERREVDAVPLTREPQLDAVVTVSDGARAAELAELVEHLDGALLEDAGADRLLDLLALAAVDHDRVDAGDAEQVREQQPGGAGADDGDAGAYGLGHGVSFDGWAMASISVVRVLTVRDGLPIQRESRSRSVSTPTDRNG